MAEGSAVLPNVRDAGRHCDAQGFHAGPTGVKNPSQQDPARDTLAAILREIGAKAQDTRFRKIERGKFEFNR